MQTPPYAFVRDGQPVAHLNANGSFSSNADGTGWYEYDSFAEFLDESGIIVDPVNFVSQLAVVVNGTPQINMAALAVSQAVNIPGMVEPAPAAAPKTRKGRKRADGTAPAAGATVVEMVPAPAAPAPVHVDPAPQAPTGDPAYLAFLKSQREAADKLRGAAPEQPAQVTGSAPAPEPVVHVTAHQRRPPNVTAPAPADPLPGGTAPMAPTAKPLGNPTAFASQINTLIETHGYSAVVDCVLDWSVQRLSVAVQQLHTMRSVSTGL